MDYKGDKLLKVMFDDYLHSYLNFISEEHGNYYAKWNDEFIVTLVDENGKQCDDINIYEKLSSVSMDYKFKLNESHQFTLFSD